MLVFQCEFVVGKVISKLLKEPVRRFTRLIKLTRYRGARPLATARAMM